MGAEEKLADAVAKNDVSTVIGMGGALKFNGGGHLNHSIFWQNLCPGGSGEPSGALAEAITRDFGSFEAMKKAVCFNCGCAGIRVGMVGIQQGCRQTSDCHLPQSRSSGSLHRTGPSVWH